MEHQVWQAHTDTHTLTHSCRPDTRIHIHTLNDFPEHMNLSVLLPTHVADIDTCCGVERICVSVYVWCVCLRACRNNRERAREERNTSENTADTLSHQ